MLVYEKNCTRLAVIKKLKFEKERLVLSDRKRKEEATSGMSLNNYKTDRSISTLKKRVSMQSSMLSPSERSPSCMKEYKIQQPFSIQDLFEKHKEQKKNKLKIVAPFIDLHFKEQQE